MLLENIPKIIYKVFNFVFLFLKSRTTVLT
jgi:hypothetical protein